MVVLGGGPIGVELAQALARFGTAITVVEAAPRLLPGEEPEAGPLLDAALEADGADVRAGVRVEAVRHDDSGFAVALDRQDGGPQDELRAERLLVATGRRTRLDLGLDAVGLEVPDDGLLATDDRLPRGAAGDLHRSRGGRGRTHRGGRP